MDSDVIHQQRPPVVGSSRLLDCELATPSPSLRIANVAVALSQALDAGRNLPGAHSLRCCILGMRIARELRVNTALAERLYYGLLLKGADYCAAPVSLGKEHSVMSQVVLLSEMLDVWSEKAEQNAALDFIAGQSGLQFERELVSVVAALAREERLWIADSTRELAAVVLSLDPLERSLGDSPAFLDAICRQVSFAIDKRSHLGCAHSFSVSEIAATLARRLALGREHVGQIRYAALLHDLGKVLVPQALLRKKERLTARERKLMCKHVVGTWNFLKTIPHFGQVAAIASSHHERLDGTGYFRGLAGRQLSLSARILMVADVFDALTSERPYRARLPISQALKVLRSEIPHKLDAICVEVLESCIAEQSLPVCSASTNCA